MTDTSRRTLFAAAGAVGLLAAKAARAAPDSPVSDDPGPSNAQLDAQNRSALTPPSTDHGDLPAFKYPFAQAHTRTEDGGWARQVTAKDFPIAESLAGVDMRLTAGGIRELHWHKPAEWSYMLTGHARITSVDQLGRHFAADAGPGDLWYFPSGIPHSIQGLGPDGCEFLLVFDDGKFSEFATFLLTDWFAHTPREVLAKNFGTDPSSFADIPPKELYIFQGQVPPPLGQDLAQSQDPAIPEPFNFGMASQAPIANPGGTVRIADSRNFKAARTIAAALVEVNPGAMRTMHWHPNADEWQFYISGEARMTVFAAGSRADTADFQAGDVGYVPRAMGHYIENTGEEPVRFLEIFRSDRYESIELADWLANTPKELVQAHLHLQNGLIDQLKQPPVFVVG